MGLKKPSRIFQSFKWSLYSVLNRKQKGLLMYVLSFKPSNSKYFGSHDAATIIMKDSQILSIIEEERLTRKKNAHKTFPHLSILKSLEINELKISDIDSISIPFQPDKWFFLKKDESIDIMSEATKIVENDLRKIFPTEELPPIKYYNHHLCHAASAYYLSGFDECLIVTADGTGEEEATAVYAAEGGKIRKLQNFVWPDSLGIFYSTLTGFLGFKPNSGEGQTMGLAPYGKPDENIERIFATELISYDNYGYKVKKKLIVGDYETRYALLEEIFSVKKLIKEKRNDIDQIYKNIAYYLQKTVEEIIIGIVCSNQQKLRSKNLCLAGGLAMNVSLNSKIFHSGLVDNIFIQPLAGDNGCMIGSAILEIMERTNIRNFTPLEHLYYGTEYSNEYILDFLKSTNTEFSHVENPWEVAAKLVADGKVIGWFNGRMEAGARALGNRSIISNPCKPQYKDLVNDIKDRERWRPLAMSILEEFQHDYIDGIIPQCAKFMIIALPVRKGKINRIPAAVHVDGSTRPQIVSKKDNLIFHNLIHEFYKLTGIPLVMNTSLNGRGEPIVESPEQAHKFFMESDLDAIFLQNFVVFKDRTLKL